MTWRIFGSETAFSLPTQHKGATKTPDQCGDAYLSCDGRPHFERVVVGAADDAVAAELEAGDHMVVVTFQHLKSKRGQ